MQICIIIKYNLKTQTYQNSKKWNKPLEKVAQQWLQDKKSIAK